MGTQAIATAKEVFDLLREDLCAVERELTRDGASSVGAITEIADYLREGGGKRIRPSLLLLAARALDYTGNGMFSLGAVVEMVHTATLVHDDIIDGAGLRRGRPSPNTTWGNSKCVLAGDWLYMQAFRVSMEQHNFRVMELLVGLTQQLVEGEMLQLEKLGRVIRENEYYDLIFKKTACLFHVSMCLGAVLAGASASMEEQLGEYGRNLGIAFQIVDDLLDLTATEAALGKPVASDLREGKATLAVVHAYQHGTAQDRSAIRLVLEDMNFDRISHAAVLEILHRQGSVEYALNAAFEHAESARAALADVPDSEYKRALLWMPDYVVARDK